VDLDLTFAIQLGLFFVVLIGLSRILIDPLQHLIEERERRMAGSSAEAQRLGVLTLENQRAYFRRLQEAKLAASRELESMRRAGRERERELHQESREQTARDLGRARAEISTSLGAAKGSLDAEVEVFAVQTVEKLLGRQV